MHLSEHSLRQLDHAYLDALDEVALRGLSAKLLDDLKEARDRLSRGPDNSSRPPSSRAPWERKGGTPESDEVPEERELDLEPVEVQPVRRPGKQRGAPGIGRTRVFQAHEERPRYPEVCAGCGRPLERVGAVAHTGFQAVDLRWDDPARPGLTPWVVDHRHHETPCPCGHRTRAVARPGAVDPLLAGIDLSEWRLVGPGLTALIVGLALRFRLCHLSA